MIQGLNEVEVVTLFVEDLVPAKEFYQKVFDARIVYEDSVSAVLKLKNVMLNLLKTSSASVLVEPGQVSQPGLGARMMFTIAVQDVDAICAELGHHGVSLLNGPIDRPWGRRTATFSDPAGNVWEVAQNLPGTYTDMCPS